MALGDPSTKELTCLANLREWEQGLEFDRHLRGGGGLKPVECAPYGREMTPWQCLENQLSLYCLPGWPCETCEGAVTIQIPPDPPLEKGGEKEGKVGQPSRDPAVMVSSFSDPGGAPALNIPKTKPKRLPAWWWDATPAVRKSWLRETG